jgi:hypothetical protein
MMTSGVAKFEGRNANEPGLQHLFLPNPPNQMWGKEKNQSMLINHRNAQLTLRAMRSLLAHFTYLIAYTIITEHTLLMGRSILTFSYQRPNSGISARGISCYSPEMPLT